jgi:hypothetical protein
MTEADPSDENAVVVVSEDSAAPPLSKNRNAVTSSASVLLTVNNCTKVRL